MKFTKESFPVPIHTIHEMIIEAREESQKSECLRKKVGAVLLAIGANEIVGRGFGGALVTCEECLRDVEEWRQDGCWSIHSELRAISDAMDSQGWTPDDMRALNGEISNSNPYGDSLIMFVTHGPCDQCLKYMEFFGIRTCIYEVPYHDNWKKWSGRIDVYSVGELHELL